MGNYILTTRFDFGKYSGQTLKDVYIKDPYYVQWCMATHNSFCLNSLTLEYLRKIKSFHFTKEAFDANLQKLKGTTGTKTYTKASRNRTSSNDNYEFEYEKYGGYNGYDDNSIDSAFEGDEMNTWNCD